MMSDQRWETRPLEIWGKAKELRAKWQASIDNKGGLLAHGNTGEVNWAVCFPALTVIEDNPAGAMIAAVSDPFARQCRLASEVRGWGRELCGYVLNCWGAMFLDREVDGSPFALRDMVIPFPDVCDQHTMRGQQAMDFSPIPRWGGDYTIYQGPSNPERDKIMVDHKTYCHLKLLNDIECIFGQKFDDEQFIKLVKARHLLEIYGLKLSQLMTNVPAPLGQKELYSFYTLGMLTKLDPDEILAFWKELIDEVQWRVDNHIAALATERYRWIEAHPPSWHFLKYYRYMEKYGAVCVGSQYSHMMGGPMALDENCNFCHRDVPRVAEDFPLETREDGVRSHYYDARGPQFWKIDEYIRPHTICEFAKALKADGAIMPLWRAGVGCALFRKEQALELSRMGIRVLHYEGNQPGDRTDMDEHRFIDQLDTWMESQGLRKLED